jgi:hypothetical protein
MLFVATSLAVAKLLDGIVSVDDGDIQIVPVSFFTVDEEVVVSDIGGVAGELPPC